MSAVVRPKSDPINTIKAMRMEKAIKNKASTDYFVTTLNNADGV